MIFLNRLIQDFCVVGKVQVLHFKSNSTGILPFRIYVINPSKVLLKIADLPGTDFQIRPSNYKVGFLHIKGHFNVMKEDAIVIFIHLLRQTQVEEKL